ncbi:Glycosyltransferase involved in cell wall bisynthesis [Hathewaya proteolytica DSM 3090]|uniref:Glycosyltransferase involved in cell wall bisynthesis n=1 Tax=Hathewaya proteolytica DSM 3090 TaxID=1121331 RepID=A0A1M6QUH0_9CLOT|nr:glycosyltransferase [Hathewaya proteolytica]SHK23815.1 Glycosyltransferase involved in cell wall bisynthesis [Hathewaya proteolytica DSM 3090]
MHVMFIPSWYSSKSNEVHGSFFKEQALALQREGIKVTVAYNEIFPITKLGRIGEKKGLSFQVEDGLNTYRYKGYNFLPKNPLMFQLFNRRMDSLYKEVVRKQGKVDVIHAQSSMWAGISALYISKKYNIPLVITEHSSLIKAKHLRNSYKKHVYNAYMGADILIAVGNGLKSELEDFTKRNDIEVVPNIVNNKLFIPFPVEKEYEFSFFSLGYLEGNKGMKELIIAFTEAFRGGSEHLVIGGDGSEKETLQNLIRDSHMESQIHLIGALSRQEVAEEMNKCDAFVLASPYETFGVVYIEAMFCGKPVIGLYNGGADNIIKSYNGIIIEKNNGILLRDALIYMKNNIQNYSSEKICKETMNKYSSNTVAKIIFSLYNKVCRKM